MKIMKVWVYHDSDHGDIKLFKTKKAAQKWAEKHWPDCDGDDLDEYVTIFEAPIND